jgi:hypothetical protein
MLAEPGHSLKLSRVGMGEGLMRVRRRSFRHPDHSREQ